MPNAANVRKAIGNASGNSQPFSVTKLSIKKRYSVVLIVSPANVINALNLFKSNKGAMVHHTTINAPAGYNAQFMVRSMEKFIMKQTKVTNNIIDVITINGLLMLLLF